MKKWLVCMLALLLLCMAGCNEQTPLATTEPTTVPTTQATEPPPPPPVLTGERIVDGRSRCTAVYSYDENGRIIHIDRKHDSNNKVYDYEDYTYDESGKLIKHERWLNTEVPAFIISYEYDENGLLVRINNEKVHEAIWNWYEVIYDDQGRVEMYNVHDLKKYNDALIGYIYFTYDQQGRETLQEEYDLKENLLRSVTTVYNEFGQIAQVETLSQGTHFDTRTIDTYEYYDDGRIKTLIHEIFSDDLPFSTVKTAYIWE